MYKLVAVLAGRIFFILLHVCIKKDLEFGSNLSAAAA